MADGLNLRYLLVGDPVRLRYAVRFSTCHKVHNESVAEHSYYVALYATIICGWVYCSGYEVRPDLENVMQRALYHDLEECVTGDINRVFKYSHPLVTDGIQVGANAAMEKILAGLDIPLNHRQHIYRLWMYAKHSDEGCVEGHIVKFADYLSVLSYMMQELTNANITMREHWTTMSEYADLFQDEEFDFIRPLVDEARVMLHEAFNKMEV